MKSTSSNLAPRELYRYDWRAEKFLEKFRNAEPLTLVDGGSVILKYDKTVDVLISARSRLRLSLTGIDGKVYALSNFAKTAEFGGGGGIGGGTALTKLTESAQAIYAQARMMHRFSMAREFEITPGNLESAYLVARVDEPLETIINDLPDDWKRSCSVGAEALNEMFSEKFYQFHRGSEWVLKLETLFKQLNAKEQLFSNLNKWSPADIYMVSNAGEAIDFSAITSIAHLNATLVRAFETRDIIGVSLKLLGKTAKISFQNVGQAQKEYKLDRVSVGTAGFFSSKDALVFFGDKDKIQFRTFPETFQGEIKGKNANHGKISYGPIQTILRSLALPPLTNIKTLRKMILDNDGDMLEEFYFMYCTHCSEDKLPIEAFVENCRAKGSAWMFSKFLSLQLVHSIVQFGKGNEFVTACIRYASSSSEQSAPFAKLE